MLQFWAPVHEKRHYATRKSSASKSNRGNGGFYIEQRLAKLGLLALEKKASSSRSIERDFKRTFHPTKCANERHSSLLITANVMQRFHFHLLGVTAGRLFMKGSNLDFFFYGKY